MQSGIVPSADQVTSQDIVNCRAAMYGERRKKYGTLPKSLAETVQTLRVMPLNTHKKEDFLMFCEETNSHNGMVLFSTSTNLRTNHHAACCYSVSKYI